MNPVLVTVEEKKNLFIKWDDNTESRIKLANLRNNCPCAICTQERNERGEKYIPIFNKDEISIKKINIIGNYALGIEWNDNHNTGIYEFGLIKKLS